MIKKITVITLTLSILATLVRYTTPYLWYYANYDYIAHELCENRHNPELECNGQCQLTKMVQKQHDHNDRQPAASIDQEQKINLFYGEYADSPTPSLVSPFHPGSDHLEPLWTAAPPSPPPRAV